VAKTIVAALAAAIAVGTPSSAAGRVLYRTDLPRGYQYGDDSGCGLASASEGDWPKLRPLFAEERPHTCAMQLEWVWRTKPRYPPMITSAAYVFPSESGARRAFAARDELAGFTAALRVRSRTKVELGDEGELLRGRGLNNSASGVVWRHGDVVAALIVERRMTQPRARSRASSSDGSSSRRFRPRPNARTIRHWNWMTRR